MKVLIVLTSHDKLGDTGSKTGLWLEEFAAPYYVFMDASVETTLASPKGGRPPVGPRSEEPRSQTTATKCFAQDKAAQSALADTTRLACPPMTTTPSFILAVTARYGTSRRIRTPLH
jgi:hypothetical protein